MLAHHFSSYPTAPSTSLPPLSDPAFDGAGSDSFPLYRDPPPFAREELIDPSSLPSDATIQRSVKVRLTKKATEDTVELSEDALRTFYRALIESGQEESLEELKRLEAPEGRLRIGSARRIDVLASLERRLWGVGPSVNLPAKSRDPPSHHHIAAMLSSIAPRPSGASTSTLYSAKGKEKAVIRPGDLPLGLLGRTEWNAVFEEFVSRACPHKCTR